MYNILVVDDSALMRKVMCDIINGIQGFSATDISADGNMALRSLRTKKYDAATINMYLPGTISGIDVLQTMKDEDIMIPVVAISSAVKEDRESTVLALEAGAVDMVVRPFRLSPAERPAFSAALAEKLQAAVSGRGLQKTSRPTTSASRPKRTLEDIAAGSVVGSVSARARKGKMDTPAASEAIASTPVTSGRSFRGKYGLVAIACSTGGPQALHTMVPMLPGHLGVPVVIVQHMPRGFTGSLAERLHADSKINVKEAEDGEVLKPDWVYIAPGGRHLQIIERTKGVLCARVYDDPPVNNLRPCADVMYESLLHISLDTILCAVLTGMGADGTQGISDLRKAKNIYTITQDEASCVVYGMPKAAANAGLSDEVVPITMVANSIKKELGV